MNRWLPILVVLLVVVWGCTRQDPAYSGGTRSPAEVAMDDTDAPRGLQIKVTEGSPDGGRQAQVPKAQATPLSAEQTRQVLSRLTSPLPSGEKKDFSLREKSQPAPRAGATVQKPFPPPEKPDRPEVATGPLQVLRHAPEGDVPIAPQLSVTFNQPMVPITSHAELAAMDVPVKLTPQPEGTWRWIGTQTLLFVPTVRFPMATKYTVEVPAGTKSATGNALASAATWTFTTPPPTVQSFTPQGGPVVTDPLLYATFDQDIDKEALLGAVQITAGSATYPARLATPDEIAQNDDLKRLASAEGPEKKRFLAFRATKPFPQETSVTVTFPAGTPSAEGPLETTSPQSYSFSTYGPLKVVEHECGWGGECRPFTPFRIRFSNPLDGKAFQQSWVKASPEIAGMKASVSGDTLMIEGATKGRTTYKITLDPKISDEFGQTLGDSPVLSFSVGSAEPALQSMGGNFVVVDPEGKPSFTVYSINHKSLRVKATRVGPSDWPAFSKYMQEYSNDKPPEPPGKKVLDTTIDPKAEPDELAETDIDLAPALDNGFGQLVLVVEPTVQPPERWRRQKIVAWVQATQIGLDAFVDQTRLYGWATSLKDGSPLAGVDLQIVPIGGKATTKDNGQAIIDLSPEASERTSLLVGRKGADTAILPENTYWWSSSSGWYQRIESDQLRWYTFDDRKMYRPGEEVHVKGWIRKIGGGTKGDVTGLDGAATGVAWALKDSRGNDVAKGSAKLNALGGFDLAFTLPKTMNLGNATLHLSATGGNGSAGNLSSTHSLQVQEFRRPEFEVSAKPSEGPHFVGGYGTVTVSADYYAGGGLPNAQVSWNVTTTPGWFTPPGRGDFTFGFWVPWWESRGPSYGDSTSQQLAGRTDTSGKHTVRIDFTGVNPPRPSNVTAEASVMDVNRQAWNASSSMLVHPADLYVGLKSDRTFVQAGEPLRVQAIVTDLDGKAVSGKTIRLRAERLDWAYRNGEYVTERADAQDATLTSGPEALEHVFNVKTGGEWRVRAAIEDDKQRPNLSELTLWVAGGKMPPQRNVEQQKATLIPDKKDYKPGDVARILVQAPFYPAQGLLSLRRSGIVETQRFTMDGPSHTLEIPIDEPYIPNVHVQVDLVGAAERAGDDGQPDPKLPKRPAFAVGALDLSVPPLSRTLKLTVTPQAKGVEPGADTSVDIVLEDANGKPVSGGEVAVVVVDEAVLALTGYDFPDPISAFYDRRPGGATDYHLRSSIQLASPVSLQQQGAPANGYKNGAPKMKAQTRMDAGAMPPMPSAAPAPASEAAPGGGGGEPQPAIRVRTNLDPLAVFSPDVPTDAAGRATVKIKMPDNLTRYRVFAVAVSGGKAFGSGDSAITARLPLMVRPSAPRFLNFGDSFLLPVVVQNQTDNPLDVQVATRASNVSLLENGKPDPDGTGFTVTVPANDRVEVLFPVTTQDAGTAVFQMAAVSGRWADAAEVKLPVWTPATTEAFATYGVIDRGGIVQPVQTPGEVWPQFGGLEITTTSTALQSLTDALLYLQAYPFECAEQLSSRIISVAALRDVLTAFKADGLPSPQAMIAAVKRDVERLRGMQNDDGGFAFWKRGDPSWPYVTIYATDALVRAKAKGFEVPQAMLDRAKPYLQNIESHIPHWYGMDARRALIAFSINVRQRMGDKDPAKARKLIAEAGLDKLPIEAVGWILPVLSADPASKTQVADIRRLLNNRATETAGTAHFVTDYSDSNYVMLHSDRRADAIILDALILDQPKSDLIPKIVAGLLNHRKKGRWENTQENTFVLVALDRYFNTYEKTTPDFVARVWLGDAFAGQQAYKGRSTERHNIDIPMSWLEGKPEQDLVMTREGAGRLYYRLGMQYAPKSLKLDPSDHGFTVQRTYEWVDDKGDVRRDPDGTWHLKAGARVRVRLNMVNTSRRYHVALVDPLPAGLEPMNPSLLVTGSIPQDPSEQKSRGPWWWWSMPWYEHQNMRDERVEAFASLLWEGVHEYSYVARATTPGTFVVPPTKAEEMYAPETFGRSSTDRVIVE